MWSKISKIQILSENQKFRNSQMKNLVQKKRGAKTWEKLRKKTSLFKIRSDSDWLKKNFEYRNYIAVPKNVRMKFVLQITLAKTTGIEKT